MYKGENISLGADNRNNDISIEDLGMKETDSMIVFTEFDDITPSDHDCHDEILSITVEVNVFRVTSLIVSQIVSNYFDQHDFN